MVLQKVSEVLADYKGIEASSITPETTFAELELDSLDRVELIMSLEEAFQVQIDTAAMPECVRDLVAIIEQKRGGKA